MSLGLALCIIFGILAAIWAFAKNELSSTFWFLLAFWCYLVINGIPLFH